MDRVGIRELLLAAHTLVWMVVVIIVAANNGGEVPPALWTVLPLGVTGILVAFRTDGNGRKNGS
jgi:hypothetical protein